MFTVSEQFRQAREAQHLTVQQVAEMTKMRTDHVRAFEEGNFNVFSAPVYLRGFARTYAKLLKLDGVQMLAALEVELRGTEKFSEPPPLSNKPRGVLDFLMLQLSRLNKNNVRFVLGVLAVVVVAGLGWFIWQRTRPADPLADLKPAVYEPAQNNSGDTLALPPHR